MISEAVVVKQYRSGFRRSLNANAKSTIFSLGTAHSRYQLRLSAFENRLSFEAALSMIG